MKFFSTISSGFDIRKQARELNVPVWQTPSVLFAFMGVITIVFMIVIYTSSRTTGDPFFLVISEVSVVTVILLVGGFVIRLFEQLARNNNTKSEFIAVASHQMRSPLSQMKWLIELFYQKYGESVSPDCKELVEKIEGANSHLIRLAGDLLDAARIEQGEMVVIKGKVDIIEIIQEVIKHHEIESTKKQIEVRVNVHKKKVWVLGDAKRLHVVIDNIISNAIKYTRDKGLVEIHTEDTKKGFQISVKDNGIGISENEQRRVYEKFFRANNVMQVGVTGTGLGLYLARNIIKQLNGQIWFKSIEDVGTLFCVRVPYFEAIKDGK